MSITVEIKECSQPPTWTLSHTHCKKGQQNTEPMSWHWTTNMAEPLVTERLTWYSVCEGLLVWTSGFSMKHSYERTSVDYRMAGTHTLRYFTSLGSGSVVWTMLCEGEGWGKGKVPWNRTCTMVTHFDRLILPSSIVQSNTIGAKKKWTFWVAMFLLFTPL